MVERITYATEDGVTIVGNLFRGGGVEGGGAADARGSVVRFAILLHMMPAVKESWNAFAALLADKGFTSLAVDTRGHGESTMGGALNFRAFTDVQHQETLRDVEGAFVYLQSLGANEANTVLIGASIGANLALRFQAAHAGIARAIALSPGLDYRGVTTQDALARLTAPQRALLVTSDDDPESAVASKNLNATFPARTELWLFSGYGHGTRMFDANPGLMLRIIEWIT